MSPNIEILLIGDDVGFTGEHELTGATITYGINTIPVAVVELTPTQFGTLSAGLGPEGLGSQAGSGGGLSLLCDLEVVRRKKVILQIRTSQGCLSFHGVIDGLSTHQSFGSIGLQLVIKSRWQVLLETFPKTPGVHPASTALFHRLDTFSTNSVHEKYFGGATNLGEKLDSVSISTDLNIVDYMVQFLGLMVKAQYDAQFVGTQGSEAYAIVELATKLRTTTLEQALALFKQIDTSAVAGLGIAASYGSTHDLMNELILNSNWESIYDLLIGVLDAFGCALIIGDEKAFVVPNVGFLKVSHFSVLPKKPTDRPNEAHPGQYQAFSFDDNGHRDISACFVGTNPVMSSGLRGDQAGLGSYIDPNARGGVLVTVLPQGIALGVASLYAETTAAGRKAIAAGDPTFVGPLSESQVAQAASAADEATTNAFLELQQKFMDNWAQIKYLQAKYGDRTGSYSSVFNPNVCPGVVGTLLSRYPSTYIDHMVTGVRHTFRMTPPAEGQADTTVQFNSGRLGKPGAETGVDTVKLYDYDEAKAVATARLFVKDVTTL